MAGLQALELHDVEKDAASFIKKSFDEKFEPTWHCIVGKSFGALHLGSVSWIDCNPWAALQAHLSPMRVGTSFICTLVGPCIILWLREQTFIYLHGSCRAFFIT